MADNFETLIDCKDIDINQQVIFDCRSSLGDHDYGRMAYEKGHIPGAIFVDLETDLSGPIVPGKTSRHPLPDRQAFLHRAREWGLTETAQVVVYDDNIGAFAARLWWMIRWLGHHRVAVLDGGYDAWLASGGSISVDAPSIEISDFQASEPLTRSVNASMLPDDKISLLDARESARFKGDAEPIDPVAGHIPGARCLPFAGNVTEGRFLSQDLLRDRFSIEGITVDDDVICYCGSGVTACHNILAFKHAGYPEPALYAGSWSEWITDPNRPIASGD